MAASEGEVSRKLDTVLGVRVKAALLTSPAVIEITLRCSDHLDEYNTRTFKLRPGDVVHIGRASKNAAKPELMIGPGNAYIDSPTISREHAVLTATAPPAACVYVTDKGSMHGTMVNGNKLEPQKAQRLNNGDILQFGANVTREQRRFHEPSDLRFTTDAHLVFYTARQFTFESSLPSYPHGFTVPESSDEEEVEVDEGMSCPRHYGTQRNPFTIDDVDESRLSSAEELAKVHKIRANVNNDDEFDDDELDKDLRDTTIPSDASQDAQERSPSPDVDDDNVFYPEDVSTTFPAPSRYAFVEQATSEGGASPIYSSDDEPMSMSHVDSCASVADSDESLSDGDMELEDIDDEEQGGVAAPETYAMQLRLLEQQNKRRTLERANLQNGTEARGTLTDALASPDTKKCYVGDSVEDGAIRIHSSELCPFPNTKLAAPAATVEAPRIPEPELRFEPMYTSNGVYSDSFEGFSGMEAMPPRPAAPRPMQWNMVDYTSPFSPRACRVPHHLLYSDVLLATNSHTFGPTYSNDFVCNYPGRSEPLLPNPYAAQPSFLPDNPWEPSKSSSSAPVSGVQTPPPAPSFENSSPPVRRTEVSIREIVEDVTQQPPTPTSVTSGLKRKADVLDEAVEVSDEEPTPDLQSTSSGAAPDAAASEAVEPSDATLSQRPKKRLRYRLGSAVKTAAAWMVPGVVGAAASVAFLTSVPNDFFVA
ncbi:uncharacterized protein N0V89_009015 [Didymosphaeria variabile]|uniref:FHA domain-containing protein n=1 Tax=Didymosphaeria variabile TaxID=1932322 RepID=A0A9W8XGU4_9PLEO|nr:uncharacterized protein N0V89_009015 [Didymosphaeria variabile]KAJ4350394.1 hypothetical protein N0V89_009015 [Didymosphaeria variabile]